MPQTAAPYGLLTLLLFLTAAPAPPSLAIRLAKAGSHSTRAFAGMPECDPPERMPGGEREPPGGMPSHAGRGPSLRHARKRPLCMLWHSPTVSLTGALSPAAVVEHLQRRLDGLTDYDCRLRTETHAGTRVEAAEFHLWYRKPGLLRLRVLRGRHRGSELLLGADGVLRGRRGGLLRAFSRRLNRSDPSLRSLRGQPAWELDFGSFVRALRERMALPGSTATVQPPTATEPRLILEVRYRPPGAPRPLRDVWSIDPATWLLAGGDVFEGNVRIDHVEFSQIYVDAGLKESWFHF